MTCEDNCWPVEVTLEATREVCINGRKDLGPISPSYSAGLSIGIKRLGSGAKPRAETVVRQPSFSQRGAER